VAIDPKKLPKDPEILQQIVVDLTRQLDKSQRLLQQLLITRSGTRSEQLSPDQLRLFAQQVGIELAAPETAKQEDKQQKDDDEPPVAGSGGDSESGKKRGRQPLPGHLKRERIVHDLAEQDKHCAECDEDLRRIGEEVSERYEYVPAQMLVIEDACQKYACACTVKTATKPAQPIEKSTAGASVLAHVIVSKLADHLPVHRQTKIMRRFGVEISDQTMCGWLRQSAELLAPLYGRLKEFVLSSKVVGTDDTPGKVLDRELSRRSGSPGGHLRLHADARTSRARKILSELSRLPASRCLCSLRQLLHQSRTRVGGGWVLGARKKTRLSSSRSGAGSHGRGAGLHCSTLCGGKAGQAVRDSRRGLAVIA